MIRTKIRTTPSAARERTTAVGSQKRQRPALPSARVALGASLLLVGTVGLSYTLSSRHTGVATEVVLAASQLPKGDVLTSAQLRSALVYLPAQTSRAQAVADPLSLIGKSLTVSVQAGQFLTPAMVNQHVSNRGARTIAIPVDPEEVLAAHIEPGDSVDVAVTYGSGATATTTAVAVALLVTSVTDPSSSISASQAADVTVKITSLLQGLAIAQAENAGKITLIRSTGASIATNLPTYPPVPSSVVGGAG